MEDSAKYSKSSDANKPEKVKQSDPFAGADAAMLHASKKAIARARTAGLEPVLWEDPKDN